MKPYGWQKIFTFKECPCCDGPYKRCKTHWTKRAKHFARQQWKKLIKKELK